MGNSPLKRCAWRAVCGWRVTAMMGHLGRYWLSRCAERPDVVITTMADAIHLVDASTAAMATDCAGSRDLTWKVSKKSYKQWKVVSTIIVIFLASV